MARKDGPTNGFCCRTENNRTVLQPRRLNHNNGLMQTCSARVTQAHSDHQGLIEIKIMPNHGVQNLMFSEGLTKQACQKPPNKTEKETGKNNLHRSIVWKHCQKRTRTKNSQQALLTRVCIALLSMKSDRSS